MDRQVFSQTSRFKAFLIWTCLALLGVGEDLLQSRCCVAMEASIEIDCASPGDEVNPNFFGQNIPVSISGIWDSRSDTINPESEASVRRISPTVLRFPAGVLADMYFWEDGLSIATQEDFNKGDPSLSLSAAPAWANALQGRVLGPSAGRHGNPFHFLRLEGNVIHGAYGLVGSHPAGTPVRLDHRNGQPGWFQNGFGTCELMKLGHLLGSGVILTVNFGTGIDRLGNVSPMASLDQRVKRAAAWVAFINGQASDTRPIGSDAEGNDWKTVGYWARKRVETGRAEPWRVTTWEVGNESFCQSGPGFTGAGKYAEGFMAFAKAMKAVDPAIKVGAPAMSDPAARGDADSQDQWNSTVLRTAKSHIDFIAVHPYYPSALNSEVSRRNEDWFRAVMAGATHAMMDLARIREQADQIPPLGKTLEIVLSEYGIWPAESKDPRDFSNLARAVYDSDLLVHLLRNGGRLGVSAATGWNLQSNTETALIKYDWNTGRILLRPQYHSMHMLRKLMGGHLLPVTIKSPEFSSPKLGNMEALEGIPVIQALATLHEGGKIKLFVVNRHVTKELKTGVRLRNSRVSGQITVTTVSAPSPSSHNEENPREVQPLTHFVESETESSLHVFPPHSVTLLELDKP